MEEIYSLDSALEAVRKCLAKAQKEIFEELEQCVNSDTIITRTGNFHTQLGRIQFWKNIQSATSKGIGSPHRKGLDKNWYFCSNNSCPTDLKIGEENYKVQTVVKQFLSFLEETEKMEQSPFSCLKENGD